MAVIQLSFSSTCYHHVCQLKCGKIWWSK